MDEVDTPVHSSGGGKWPPGGGGASPGVCVVDSNASVVESSAPWWDVEELSRQGGDHQPSRSKDQNSAWWNKYRTGTRTQDTMRESRVSSPDGQTGQDQIDMENWMGNLQYRYSPLYGIAIPGSHGAFSYSLDKGSPISPDLPCHSLLNKIPLVRGVAKHVIYRWYRTQTLTVKEQLHLGVRYLQIRTAVRRQQPSGDDTPVNNNRASYLSSTTLGLPSSQSSTDRRSSQSAASIAPSSVSVAPSTTAPPSEFFVVNGLYGGDLLTLLREVRDFLQRHSKEVVILDFDGFYDFELSDHHKLQHKLVDLFSGMICPSDEDLEDVTLSFLWSRRYSVLLFYRYRNLLNQPLLWPTDRIIRCGIETRKPEKLVRHLEQQYAATGRPDNFLFVNEAVLTSRPGFVLRHLCRSLRSRLAPKANAALAKWLSDKTAGEQEINVVCADFVAEMTSPKRRVLARDVVALNEKRASLQRTIRALSMHLEQDETTAV